MKLYYDFHIHTALSPCGDNDMTPNNIVNMSLLKELDCIAITDHNACGNIEAVMDVAKKSGENLIVIPGMEVESMEEIHIVCLFPNIERAIEFEKLVKANLPPIKNRKKIFGDQFLFDENDNIVGEEENLLITATALDIYTIIRNVKSLGGIAYPAHIDRSSYSVISSLGFIPPDLDINIIEISKSTSPEEYVEKNKRFIGRDFSIMRSSDAHYLENINERENFIDFKYDLNIENVIKALSEL